MNRKKKKGCGCGCSGIVIVFIVAYILIRVFAEGAGEQEIDQSTILQDMTGSELLKVYDQLNDDEKYIYDVLMDGVSQGTVTFEIDHATAATFADAYTALQYDHPEYFWLTGGYEYRNRPGAFHVKLKTFDYWAYTTDPQSYIDQLNNKIDEIIAGGAQYTETYDKVKYVHDFLVKHITYDYNAAEECNSSFRSTATEHALSVYGALVNGKSICGGYSKSFYLLMNAMGVECHYLQGYAGEYHAWNYLKIEDDYYYMDVTWDDVNLKEEDGTLSYPQGVVYNYFCITGSDLLKSRTPDDGIAAPQTEAMDYNYFVHEGYYFEYYDFENVAAAIQAQEGQQIISVRFASESELNRAVTDLVDKRRIFKIDSFKDIKTFSYGRDTDLYVLTFYIK